MVEPSDLMGRVRMVLAQNGLLRGRRVVVSAGPTREVIDPVRFITNRSSGKQGIAIAQAALDAGADVTLVSGPTCEPLPYGATVIQTESAEEMKDAILGVLQGADALFMVAAVADFRPESVAKKKIKKSDDAEEGLSIQLTKTTDILMEVKEYRSKTGFPKAVLGFAAETHNAFQYGREKLERKGLDFIAVNDVTAAGAGFSVATNRVVLLGKTGVVEEMPLQSKLAVGQGLVYHVAEFLNAQENDISTD